MYQLHGEIGGEIVAKMLPTILRNLGTGPATRDYPFTPRQPVAGSRGRLMIDLENCILCSLCEKCCPAGAITVKRKEGYYAFTSGRCVVCGYCVDACPKGCLTVDRDWRKPVNSVTTDSWHVEPKKKAVGDNKVSEES